MSPRGMISIKSRDEIELMRESGRIVGLTLRTLKEKVKPGMTTASLDEIAEEIIRSNGGVPAFLGYRGFPASLCASVNEEVVHGIPSSRKLKNGDLISFDVGVKKNGYFGDAAITVTVGEVKPEVNDFIKATRESLMAGIKKAVPGNRLGDVSHAVEEYAVKKGYGVVRDFVGHGIGREMHEEPQVPNYGKAGLGPALRPGMAIAIEPMLNMGTWEVKTLKDGWTVVTKDGKLSAHFEHVVAITEDGNEILTVE